jgi:hypothetical protein
MNKMGNILELSLNIVKLISMVWTNNILLDKQQLLAQKVNYSFKTITAFIAFPEMHIPRTTRAENSSHSSAVHFGPTQRLLGTLLNLLLKFVFKGTMWLGLDLCRSPRIKLTAGIYLRSPLLPRDREPRPQA